MNDPKEIFAGQSFAQIIEDLEANDRASSFTSSELPKSYTSNGEPKVLPGQNKGLFLILDAHADAFSASSVASDTEGFIGLVHPKVAFPFTTLDGIKITPGHLNLIALSGTSLAADDSIRSIDPVDRNCYFPDETDLLTINKVYTQSNCVFECSMAYAQNRMLQAIIPYSELCIYSQIFIYFVSVGRSYL